MLRPCLEPGCPTLTQRPRCHVHARTYDRQRGSFRERGYSAAWDKAAAAFKREFPMCGMRPNGRAPVMSRCFDEGRLTATYAVDHVVPHRGDDALLWDREQNWQSLCQSCHGAKTAAGL